MTRAYVHGYDPLESVRLQDQAMTLVDLLHSDTEYNAESRVLEIGCGVGAQTVTLGRKSPDASIIALDISETSIAEAEQKILAEELTNVRFLQADIFHLPFCPQSFDHVFVCFVLEHLKDPLSALQKLKDVLRPGGTITVIEGDHGSACFYPDSASARTAIFCQVELQSRAGGNALLGRSLFPLLTGAGYNRVRVSPRMVYADSSRPEMVDGFTKKTFTAMIKAVRESAIREGIVAPAVFDKGISDLYRTTEEDGTFCYTFFKAFGKA